MNHVASRGSPCAIHLWRYHSLSMECIVASASGHRQDLLNPVDSSSHWVSKEVHYMENGWLGTKDMCRCRCMMYIKYIILYQNPTRINPHQPTVGSPSPLLHNHLAHGHPTWPFARAHPLGWRASTHRTRSFASTWRAMRSHAKPWTHRSSCTLVSYGHGSLFTNQ